MHATSGVDQSKLMHMVHTMALAPVALLRDLQTVISLISKEYTGVVQLIIYLQAQTFSTKATCSCSLKMVTELGLKVLYNGRALKSVKDSCTPVLIFSLKFTDMVCSQIQGMQICLNADLHGSPNHWKEKQSTLFCKNTAAQNSKRKQSWSLTSQTHAETIRDREQNEEIKKTTTTHHKLL